MYLVFFFFLQQGIAITRFTLFHTWEFYGELCPHMYVLIHMHACPTMRKQAMDIRSQREISACAFWSGRLW